MANDLKGITVKIGGDTQDLKKSLEGVNSSAKSTQKELTQVNKQLKYDPTNTMLVAQKHELLGSKIKDTSTKLDALKTAQSQFDEEAKKTDEGAAQYRALQREIALTEGQLESLQKQYAQTNSVTAKLNEVGTKMQEVGDKTAAVGEGITTHVTAPIVGLAAAAGASWKEVDDGMDTIVSKTGASGEALTDMQDRAKQIAETIPASFQEASDAVGEVNTRFGLTGDALSDLSEKYVKFAQINELDVTTAVDSTQSAMEAFGVSAEDAGNFLDTLNKAAQDTGVDITTLSGEMTTNASAMKQLGFNASDSAMFLANLSKQGLDSGTVISGLSKVQANAAKDGKTMQEALSDLDKEMKQSGDNTKSTQAVMELFGNKAGAKLADACKTGQLSFAALGTSMSDFAGNVDDTFTKMEDPVDELQPMLNTLKDIGADLADTAMQMLVPALESLRDTVQDLKGKWDGLSEGQQQAIIKAAGIAAAIGPVVVVIGKLTSGIGSLLQTGGSIVSGIMGIGPKLSELSLSVKGFFTLLTSNPLGIILLAITAIVGIVTVLYNTCQPFHDWVNNTVFPFLQQVGSTVVTFFQTTIVPIIQTAFSTIQIIWTTILQPCLQAIGTFIQTVLLPVFQVVFMTIGEVVSTAFSLIVGVWNNILLPVFTAIGAFLNGTLGPIFQTVFGAIRTVVQTVFSAIQAFWNGILLPAFTAIGAFLSGTLGPIFQTVFGAIRTVVQTVFSAIQGFWNSILRPVFTAIGNAADALRSAVSGPLDAVNRTFHDVFNGIKSFLEPIISWLKGIFNFSWHLPKIKLPHFSIRGSFSLDPPSVPHFSIDWYKKAMENAMVLDGATIFGQGQNGQLLGAGEAGSEVVAGEQHLLGLIKDSVKAANNETVNSYGGITINVYGAEGQDIRELTDEIEDRLNHKIAKQEAVFG